MITNSVLLFVLVLGLIAVVMHLFMQMSDNCYYMECVLLLLLLLLFVRYCCLMGLNYYATSMNYS